MISDQGLLYIEPGQAASPAPVIDEITRRMCAAFREARHSEYAYAGVHECVCGAHSTSCDYRLPGGDLTNSLCVHYVAHHRAEVPPDQLARIRGLPVGEAEPDEEELQGPELILKGVRASVEQALGQDRLSTWVAWGLDAEALYRGMQGVCSPDRAEALDVRGAAGAIFHLLYSIEARALPHLRESAQRAYGDVRRWAADALRVPGWKREAWAVPLADLMRFSGGEPYHRRSVAMCFRLLGPHAGAAVPALFELAKGATGDLRYDLGLAIGDIQRTPGLLVPAAAVPYLFEIAQAPERYPGLHLSAALVLARAGLNSELAVRALVRMALGEATAFEYPTAVLCGTLNQELGYVGEPGIEGWGGVALPLLLNALQDPDWQVRARAIKLLGRAGRDAGVAVTALNEARQDPKLRLHVEEALLRIASPETADLAVEEKRAADRAKAQVVVPPVDPKKHRHGQFFRFTCPFCSQSEVVGLWLTSKTCSRCQKCIRIVRQPGCSGCELIESAGAPPEPPARLWWQFWK